MTDALYLDVKRLKVNRGGEIDEAEIVGRERELDVLLRTLKQQSVLVAAERRIGKTTLCKQAQRRLAEETLALYQDIENVEQTLGLAAVLVKMASPHFNAWHKWQQKSSTLYKRLAEAKITLPDALGGGGFTLPPTLQVHWKELIQNTIADVPFYIHHIVGSLRDEQKEATQENIRDTVRSSITSPLDPWKMRHYKTRLERHFPETRHIACALLDTLAVSKTPCDFETLCNRVQLKITDTDDDIIGETLDLLEQDFYVEREEENQTYLFLRPLLARAWRHIQRLPNSHV